MLTAVLRVVTEVHRAMKDDRPSAFYPRVESTTSSRWKRKEFVCIVQGLGSGILQRARGLEQLQSAAMRP